MIRFDQQLVAHYINYIVSKKKGKFNIQQKKQSFNKAKITQFIQFLQRMSNQRKALKGTVQYQGGIQQEDQWNQLRNLKIRTFYNPSRDHLLQRSSKVFYFVNYFEKQLTRPKFYYHFLIIIFFLQLIGSVSSSQVQIQDKLLYYFLKTCEYTRVSPLLKDFLQIQQEAQGILINSLIIFLEVVFLITFYILGRSTTNLSDKKFKKRLLLMGYTTFFLEMQRWILFNIQADITASMMFCVQGQQNLEKRCQNNIQYSDDSLRYILIVINIVLGVFLSVINSIIHSIAQFIPINGLRSQFTNLKLFDYSFILIIHILSYLDSQLSLFAFEILAVFYFIQYFFSYPLYTKNISYVYAVSLNFFFAATILFHIRYYKNLSDSNFLYLFLVLGSFMAGVLAQWERMQLFKTRMFDFSIFREKPQETVNALQEVVHLLMEKTYQNQMTLLGIFEVHQRECVDNFCPCQYQMILNEDFDVHKQVNNGSLVPINGFGKKSDLEQFKTTRKNIYRDQEDIEEYDNIQRIKNMSPTDGKSLRQTLRKSIMTATPKQAQFSKGTKTQLFTEMVNFQNNELKNKQQSSTTKSSKTSTTNQSNTKSRRKSAVKQRTIKGSYKLAKINFSVLQQDFLSFKKWTLTFVDYQYEQLLRYLYTSRNYQLLIGLGIRYIYFEIEIKANFIKALYFVRKWAFHIDQKPYYFRVVEKSLSDLIENEIKNKDKALKYSIRKKDNLEAKAYENFESYVVIEEIKKFFNQRLQEMIKLKQFYFEKLIQGFSSLNDLYAEQKNIIKKGMVFKSKVEAFYSYHQNSPHLSKLLTIFYAVLFQDLKKALFLEDKLKDSLKKVDYYSSWYTISGLEILQGNVATVIAHFRTKVGKILKYSASAPMFFGYKKLEFDSLQSVNDVMPQIIGEKHDLFLERFIDQGQSKILRQYRQTLAKNKKGFIFPIKLYINYFFELHNDFIFSSLIVRKQSNSQYLFINQHGFIDSFSQNFYEFCQIICPQVTVQQLIHSNIYLFIEDLDTHLRECQQKSKISNLKCVLKLNSRMNEMIIKFKNYWRKDKHYNRLMYHIIRVQEEYEDEFEEEENEDIYQFDIKANLILNQFSLISGEQLILYILEIISIIPIKSDNGSMQKSNTQFSCYSQKMQNQVTSNAFIPSMTALINNKPSSDQCKSEKEASKQINFQEDKKQAQQDTHSTKITSNPINSHDRLDYEELINIQSKNYINSQKSLKSLDENNKHIISQLDEMDQDLIFMNDSFQHKTNVVPKLNDNNNLRFISRVNDSYKIVENDWLGGGQNQKNNNIEQKLGYIPITISQKNIQSINSQHTQNNLTTHGDLEQINLTHMVSPRGSLIDHSLAQINNQQEKIFHALSNNNLSINDSHIMEIENINCKSLSQLNDYNNQRALEFNQSRIINLNKVPVEMSSSDSNSNIDQIDEVANSESSSSKNKKIANKNYNIQFNNQSYWKSKSSKQIDIFQIENQQTFIQKEEKNSQFTKGTIITNKDSKVSKRSSKKEIIMKIQQMTEKNNAINIECTLSDENDEEDEEAINYLMKNGKKNNNEQDENFSIRSEGKKEETETVSEKSSHLSEVAKKIENIRRIVYTNKKPKFIALVKVIFLFIICLHIFATIGSQIFSNNYVKKIIDDSTLYEIQESTSLSFSQSISSVFGLQNDPNNQSFYQFNLNLSYSKLQSIINQLLNNYIDEYESLNVIINSQYGLQNSISNKLENFLSDIFQATSQNNFVGIQTSANSIFQISQIMESLSQKIQESIDSTFQMIKKMNLIIMILVVVLIFLSILILIKINLRFRDIVKQYLYISTRISQNEAEQEYIKLSNIINFLEQNEDQYVKFNLQHSHIFNSKQITNIRPLTFQKQEKHKHTQVLYNSINNQNLVFIKMIFFTILAASMSVTLQAVIFIVTKNQLNSLVEPLDQYKEYSQKISQLTCLNTAHQLISYQPELDPLKLSNQFVNNNIKQISSYYLENFQIIPIKGQQYYYSDQIQQLNQANSCLILDSSPQLYKECNTINQGIFIEGLLRVLRKVFQFYSDTPAQNDPATFEYIRISMLLLDILDLSQKYFQKSIELIESDEKIQKFILIIIGNIFIIIVYMILSIYLIRKMNQNIELVKYSISFIPNKRLIEDNSTIQLIKAIQN
ncbi:transmembrane protein, putative (macronuclear) [Tetrahymena thermophila SB210]|uniref:Transmembrane protein, putative n=1 Tax=Tetrahymena thermophila (strain SB210) TaxID=312017 RepID=Q22E76_TETTS|nr:transmembrane protein, putative [Tetrahymena thermophila SB210]EAR83652.2 transmembrane protein, putative [Tetrahymena thermophila SB210]|eukprot:XP_001031315.2 transmembrane protein, putative [Tetrahymena thermophila SB210]